MKIISYLLAFILLPALGVAQVDSVSGLSSPRGVYVRLNTNFLEFKTVGAAKYTVKRQKLNEESVITLGQMQVVKNHQQFQELIGLKELKEFEKMKGFNTPVQTMAYLNTRPGYKDLALFGELKVEFLQALGFAFLDNTAKKDELYRYSVYAVNENKQETLIGETSVFYNPRNYLLNELHPELSKITGSDSSVTFQWSVEFPKNIKGAAGEQIKVGNELAAAFAGIPDNAAKKADDQTYSKVRNIYIENQKVLSYSPVDDFTTRFSVYYRVNGNARWQFLEKTLAITDSSGKKIVQARVAGNLDDLVETILLPEDYVYNVGDTTQIARGVVAHKGTIELIYGVNARDSTNAIILNWQKLSYKPYYSGVEIAKSVGGDPAKVIQIMPVGASTFVDTDVYPAGQVFTYYIRPVFIPFQDLEQRVPASVAITCAKFSRPTPPFNLKVVSQGQFAKLTWEVADEKASHSFIVYRGTSPEKMHPIRSAVKEQQYTDTTGYLSARLTYYYSVMAMNVTQDTSAFAPYVSYVPVKKEEVQSPPMISFDVVNDQAVLNWSDVKLNDDFILGYVVQRKGVREARFKNIHKEIIKNASYTDKTFQRGVGYVYRVASLTVKGDTGVFSAPASVSADIEKTKPTGIENIKVTNLSKSIRVSWPGVESEEIKQYKVYRKLPKEPNFKIVGTVRKGNFEFEDKNVRNDVIYVYTVTALDSKNAEGEVVERKSLYREALK